MPFEAKGCFTRIVTLRTTERLLTRMSQQVFLEVDSLCERIFTLVALERLLSRMFRMCLLRREALALEYWHWLQLWGLIAPCKDFSATFAIIGCFWH